MHQRSTLNTRESLRINLFSVFFSAENQSATRAAQGLMSGSGNKIRVGHWAWMQPRGHKARYMSNVCQQVSPDFMRDLAHPLEINDSRVSAGAHCNHFRLVRL